MNLGLGPLEHDPVTRRVVYRDPGDYAAADKYNTYLRGVAALRDHLKAQGEPCAKTECTNVVHKRAGVPRDAARELVEHALANPVAYQIVVTKGAKNAQLLQWNGACDD